MSLLHRKSDRPAASAALLDALGDVGEEGVARVEQDVGERPAVSGPQLARRLVAHEAEVAHRLLDPRPGRRARPGRAVEHVADGAEGDAGASGDVLDRGARGDWPRTSPSASLKRWERERTAGVTACPARDRPRSNPARRPLTPVTGLTYLPLKPFNPGDACPQCHRRTGARAARRIASPSGRSSPCAPAASRRRRLDPRAHRRERRRQVDPGQGRRRRAPPRRRHLRARRRAGRLRLHRRVQAGRGRGDLPGADALPRPLGHREHLHGPPAPGPRAPHRPARDDRRGRAACSPGSVSTSTRVDRPPACPSPTSRSSRSPRPSPSTPACSSWTSPPPR